MIFNVGVFHQVLGCSKHMMRKVWLLFGNDTGRPHLILQQLRQKLAVERDNLLHLSYSDVAKEPGVLLQEIYTINPFISGKRLVVIDNCSESLDKGVETILREYSQLEPREDDPRPYVVLLAGELKKSCKMRIAFEKSLHQIAVNCYKEGEIALTKQVRDFLVARSIRFPEHLPQLIVSKMIDDSLFIANELEKILLYIGDADGEERTITEEDILAIINDESQPTFSQLAENFCLGQPRKLRHTLCRSVDHKLGAVSLLRTVQRYLAKLTLVKTHCRSKSFDAAIETLRLPLFQQSRATFQGIIRDKTLAELTKQLYQALCIERQLYRLPSAIQPDYLEFTMLMTTLFDISNKPLESHAKSKQEQKQKA